MQTYDIPAELIEMIPGYIERRDRDIIDLNSFLKERDFDSIKRLAHKLKGNGSSFGFDRLSEIGDLLGVASYEKNDWMINKLIADFEDELKEIKMAIM